MMRVDPAGSLSDKPIIFWRNVVTASNVEDNDQDPSFPASNVANPATSEKWRRDTTDSPEPAVEYFIVDVSHADEINYVAIAGHNFSSQNISVGLELAEITSPIGISLSQFEPQVPEDDGPLIFVFPQQEFEAIRIMIVPGNDPAEMAVVYAGKYTVMEEGIQADHAPLPLALVSNVSSGKSENGQFLGRIVLSQYQESSASFANMSKAWIRAELIPFLSFAAEFPFFYAWSPDTYPLETSYAYLMNDPAPIFDVDGYGSIELAMRGVSS